MGKLLMYIFYGVTSGFSQFTPVSASAHQALFSMLFKFDSYQPLLNFFVHAAALAAILMLYWQRCNHLYQEMRLVSLPPKRRRRPPDVDAVIDGRLVITAALPALLGAFLSILTTKMTVDLFALAVLLIVCGTAIYVPDYLPGGDRKSRSMYPLEAALMGLCAGLSVIAGISAMALMLAIGLIRKCDRGYILDIALMIVGVMLCGLLAVDLVEILISGFSGFSFMHLWGCLLAAMAAFGGGIGAIMTMRFLAVKTGFAGFAFYSWGLGLFSFILYLMI